MVSCSSPRSALSNRGFIITNICLLMPKKTGFEKLLRLKCSLPKEKLIEEGKLNFLNAFRKARKSVQVGEGSSGLRYMGVYTLSFGRFSNLS